MPHKILNTLGLKRQENREDILIRIFMHPVLFLWLALGAGFIAVILFIAPHANLSLSYSYWVQTQQGLSPSYYLLQFSDYLIVPILCGLGFLWAASLGDKKKDADKVAFIFSLIFVFFLILGFSVQGEGPSAFYMRSLQGGFWMASLPYLMALSLWGTLGAIVWQGRGKYNVSFLWFSVLCAAMCVCDLGTPSSFYTSLSMVAAWIATGFLIAPALFESQQTWETYNMLRMRLRMHKA